jgi:hypothetical protein
VYSQARDAVNFLQPVMKLREKLRDGAKITKRHDAARTPYRRLLESAIPYTAHRDRLRLQYDQLHSVKLKLAIEAAQTALYQLAAREGSLVSQRIALEKI